MLPTVQIAHQHKDRTRLRIPERRGNQAFFERAERLLAGRDGVANVETNPLTASILLHHSASLDDLLRYAAEQQLFTPPVAPSTDAPVLDQASHQFEQLSHYIQQKTKGSLDLEGTLFSSLVVAAIIQLFRGQVVGPASALLSYAAAILASRWSRRRSEERQQRVASHNGQSG